MADPVPDLRSVGLQHMKILQQLAARARAAAQDAASKAPVDSSELDLHQIRRQSAAASEAIDRCCYWIAQAYKVEVPK